VVHLATSGWTESVAGSSCGTGKSIDDNPTTTDLARYQKIRDTFIASIGGVTKLHAMPMAGSAIFSGWLSGFTLDLRGKGWRPYGKYICDYVSTDLDNPCISACSADLATANIDACKNQLLGSDGRKLLQDNLGCELYTRMVAIYNPSGVRAVGQS